MNNNTNSNGIQSKLSPDQVMASLGLATRLSEQLLKQQNPMQEPQEPQEQPIEEQPLELDETPIEEPIEEPIPEEPTQELPEEEPSFVADLKSMITEGFDNIKGLFKKEGEVEEPKEE